MNDDAYLIYLFCFLMGVTVGTIWGGFAARRKQREDADHLPTGFGRN